MRRAKNPYPDGKRGHGAWALGRNAGFEDGLLAGEKRLARAIRRWIDEYADRVDGKFYAPEVWGILTLLKSRESRRKRGKK